MDAHRAFHRRFFNKRQGPLGFLGSILASTSLAPSPVGQSATPPTATQGFGNSGNSGNPGNPVSLTGIVGGITSAIGNAPSLVLPSSGPSSTTTSSTPLTPSSSSSTGSTALLTSSARIGSSSASTLSAISPSTSISITFTTPTPTPTSTPTSTPTLAQSVPNTVITSADGTRIVYITSTLSPASATASPAPSFLENPSLEGGIFALVGIVALIMFILIVTWIIRKRRRDRLERDTAAAVTFDPGATDHYERQEDEMEKRRLSASSSGHSHGYGYGYGIQPAYMPQQEYHGPLGYGQYPGSAYPGISGGPVSYQTPLPAIAQPQPAAQGGANLTRKFSDRKPVPPFIPNPYDPSNTHVSIPPQFD